MRFLIAPDKFKDALDVDGVTAAMAAGVFDVFPAAEVVFAPMADGGEGTGQILADRLSGLRGDTLRKMQVTDPLGRSLEALWWRVEPGSLAVVEMATASGLAWLSPEERNPAQTTSFGTGQLIAGAFAEGCTEVLLAVGGSATVDGGAGALQACGFELLDASGRVLPAPARGRNLVEIAGLRPTPDVIPFGRMRILADVDSPLLGPRGAARLFGPQKGASPSDVMELEAGLEQWANVLRAFSGRAIKDMPGAGAAGGLPAGMVAAFGATIESGAEFVADQVLPPPDERFDWCLTGEGRFDEQTAGGKVVAVVARRMLRRGTPTVAFVGSVGGCGDEPPRGAGKRNELTEIVVIADAEIPLAQRLADTAANLRQSVATWCAGLATH